MTLRNVRVIFLILLSTSCYLAFTFVPWWVSAGVLGVAATGLIYEGARNER